MTTSGGSGEAGGSSGGLSADPSTLAALHPGQTRELHLRAYQNSPQLIGSQFMTLKRPSRLAESGREYVAGDPINLVDWKAFARTDQLIVREVRDEAMTRVMIGLDLSATMHWPTAAVPAPVSASKVEVAVRLALHLAHSHLRMGDRVELWLFPEAEAAAPTLLLKPRRPAAVLSYFASWQAQGFQAAAAVAEATSETVGTARRDLAYWVGDGLSGDQPTAFVAAAKRGLFLHVLSSLECRVDWLTDGTSYFDPGRSVAAPNLREYQGQALKQRTSYADQLQAWCARWQTQLRQLGGDYLQVTETTQASLYQSVLLSFLKPGAAGKGPV